jgi:hypothetical protein
VNVVAVGGLSLSYVCPLLQLLLRQVPVSSAFRSADCQQAWCLLVLLLLLLLLCLMVVGFSF